MPRGMQQNICVKSVDLPFMLGLILIGFPSQAQLLRELCVLIRPTVRGIYRKKLQSFSVPDELDLPSNCFPPRIYNPFNSVDLCSILGGATCRRLPLAIKYIYACTYI